MPGSLPTRHATGATEFGLFGQKLYLSLFLDLHNGYLVSYILSVRPVLSMITTRLTNAFTTVPDGTELILHSTNGRSEKGLPPALHR